MLSGGDTSSTGADGMEHIGNGAPHVGWYGGPLHIACRYMVMNLL